MHKLYRRSLLPLCDSLVARSAITPTTSCIRPFSACQRHLSIDGTTTSSAIPADVGLPPYMTPDSRHLQANDPTQAMQQDVEDERSKRGPSVERGASKRQTSNHERTAGTVIGAGKMSKTVKVQYTRQHFNRYLGKVSILDIPRLDLS